MRYILGIALILACLFSGFSLRETNIANRAIHADESEQATTAMQLYDSGEYKYNPNGPHGPTLYYWANATQKKASAEIKIQDYRNALTPVAVFALAWLILSGRYIGRGASWGACACFAMSAIAQIYSGYFVHEIIFATLIYALAICVWQFACSPNIWLALATGTLLGLAQSTKETAIISYASMFLSFGVCAMLESRLRENIKWILWSKATPKLAFAFILGAICTMVALYSSFGSNWGGVADAIKSYSHFFEKAESQAHASGFFYYFKLLFWQKCEGAKFGELPIVLLSIFGFALAIIYRKKSAWKCTFTIFAFLNALFAVLILSMITYKTPWLLLSPMMFICAVAGFGSAMLMSSKKIILQIVGFVVLAALAFWQYKLSSNASLRYHSDPRNPYIYTHTVRDFDNLIKRVHSASKYSQYETDIPVAFVAKESMWPAPFLLRKYRNVGFWSNDNIPQNLEIFDIIVCDYSTEKAIRKIIDKSKYDEEMYGIRKNLLLSVFIKKDILNKIISEN